MKVIISLANYFTGANDDPGDGEGGLVDYYTYFGDKSNPDPKKGKDLFFQPAADGSMNKMQQVYREYVKAVVTRYMTNTTVFAYELMNEPRCEQCPDGEDKSRSKFIVDWADQTSTWIKSPATGDNPGLGDTNHLLAVGDEGWFDSRVEGHAPPGLTPENVQAAATGAEYAVNGASGVDTVALMSLPNIDYGTFHYYPAVPCEYPAL